MADSATEAPPKEQTTAAKEEHKKDPLIGQQMRQVKSKFLVENVRRMIVKISDRCFRSCVNSMSTSLETEQQICIGDCINNYLDSYNLVSHAYLKRWEKGFEQRGRGRGRGRGKGTTAAPSFKK